MDAGPEIQEQVQEDNSTIDGLEESRRDGEGELHEPDKQQQQQQQREPDDETTGENEMDLDESQPSDEPMKTVLQPFSPSLIAQIVSRGELLYAARTNEIGDSCKPKDDEEAGAAPVEASNSNNEDGDGDGADSKDDDDTDKGSEGKSQTNDQDNQEQTSQLDDQSASLGRNRRVRQKNRYFLDFHCTDLTKGGRSNKCDYEPTPTVTRASNRKSNNELNHSQLEDPDKLPCVYCRKCRLRTPFSEDGGCQVCLYNRIVGSYNRRSHQKSQKKKQTKQSHLDDKKLAVTPTNNAGNVTTTAINTPATTTANSITNNDCNDSSLDIKKSPSVDCKKSPISETNKSPEVVDRKELPTTDIKLPKLDSWTPEEVADYILSKGFCQEAELFKTQSVDGISLLLMQRTDFTYGLKIKLGPALKIYDQVCKLKREFFKTVSAIS